MDLYEVEGKRLLAQFGIPVDRGFLWTENSDVADVEFPCVIKAQVLSGKRGKAGGVCFAQTREEFPHALEQVCRAEINGKRAQAVYVTRRVNIKQEHYLGVTLNPADKNILLIYTPKGGMDIEELAASDPKALLRFPLTSEINTEELSARLAETGLTEREKTAVADIAGKMFRMFWELDATTVEINPLAELDDHSYVAVDAKIVLDDNARFRHQVCTLIPREVSLTPRERTAQKYGLAYVEIEKTGDIGLIAGGAGIGMATVDTICFYGGRPFNFLDLGGGVTAEKTYHAMKLLLEVQVPQIKGVLVNVFGGGNNCQTMAQGIAQAIREFGAGKKIVVKSRGFFQEEGWRIYDELGIEQVHYGTTDEAVKKLLKAMEDTQ